MSLRLVRASVAVALTSALSTVAPRYARADDGLAVNRQEGAESCPDAAELRRLAAASVDPTLAGQRHAYLVTFTRSDGASYRAEIVDDTAHRRRSLADKGPGCGPLGRAAAVVIATMWSSEGDSGDAPTTRPASSAPPPSPASPAAPGAAPPSAPVPPIPEAPSAPPSIDAKTPPQPSTSGARWALAAGPALAAGIVGPAAPGVSADAELQFPRAWAIASVGAGVLWLPARDTAVAPGTIGVGLVAASARGCAFVGRAARFGLCARALAGALHATAQGYTENGDRSRPWFAVAPEAVVEEPIARWLRCRASVALTVPLHAQSFSVAGAGTAYDPPAVGGLFALALAITPP